MSGPLRVLTLLAAAAIGIAACTADAPTVMPDDPIVPDAPSLAKGHAAAHGKSSLTPAELNKQLAAVRSTTARFHNFDAAKAKYTDLFDPDGEGPASACMADPTAGAMGEHYINPELIGKPTDLDITKPQVLIYEPQHNGKRKLVAVEYIVTFDDAPRNEPAPELFGLEFVPLDQFGLWTLHLWLYEDNPSGLFALWNPNVSCRYTKV